MSTKPTTDPQLFATAATFSAPGYAWNGDSTKVDPTTYRASGFLPNLKLAAAYLNYLLGQYGEWLEYLSHRSCSIDYNATNANKSIDASDASLFVNDSGVLTADRVWTLADGTEGDGITVVNRDTLRTVTVSCTVLSGGSAVPANLALLLSSGNQTSITLRWVDTGSAEGWFVISFATV